MTVFTESQTSPQAKTSTLLRVFYSTLLIMMSYSLETQAANAVRPIHGEPPAPQTFPHAEMLVSTQTLIEWQLPSKKKEQNLKDASTPKDQNKEQENNKGTDANGDAKKKGTPSFVLIDARRIEEYLGGHLPGAINIESDKFQSPKTPPFFLPSLDTIKAVVKKVGITAEDRVVIYDAQGGRLAARIWFVLWAHGHEHVSILEGGFLKWSSEDRLITRKPGTIKHKGTWKPLPRPRGICALSQIKNFQIKPTNGKLPLSSILDARSFEEYKGDDIRAKIGGHIPSAVNMPWDSFIQPVSVEQKGKLKGYFTWKEPAIIHAILRASGLISTQPIVVYGQSGGRAAHLLFTLHLMGHVQAVNYYGGWREYGNREDTSVER